MADGLDPFETYTARTTTFIVGSQVPPDTLNAMQDATIEVSEALDEVAGKMNLSISGSSALDDSPAPDAIGGWTVWVEETTNNTLEVVLDASRDYRDRFLEITGMTDETGTRVPGGADDDDIGKYLDADLTAGVGCGVRSFFYTRDGYDHGGGTGRKYALCPVDDGIHILGIYARSSDGALCMTLNLSGSTATLMAKVAVSPKQNHY